MPAVPKEMTYLTSSTLFWATALAALVWLLRKSTLPMPALAAAQPRRNRDDHPEIKSSDPRACLDIIAAKSFNGQGYALKNSLTNFEARAIPNQRLVRAFGIHNSFVTSQREESAAFRKEVETLLYVEEEKWAGFATVARAIVRQQVDTESTSLRLGELIQLITLKMVRKVIWDIDPAVPNPVQGRDTDHDLRVLARAINMQWLSSKEDEQPEEAEINCSAAIQSQMRNALVATFPNWNGSDSATNPLNFILPAYETLWRVVLLCFMELTARSRPDRAKWATALLEFLGTPTREQLEQPLLTGEAEPISAIMVAKEVLRLYPPTRRVHRRFQDAQGLEYSIAANIEAVQRDPEVWGGDAAVFRPERWIDITQAMEDDGRWLPFGAKPFRCPAKRHQGVAMPFGVAVIALLTGALLEATEGEWKFSSAGALPAADVPLETGRGAYEDAELLKSLQ